MSRAGDGKSSTRLKTRVTTYPFAPTVTDADSRLQIPTQNSKLINAYRSLKEAITALELSQRIYRLSPETMGPLIDEGNQISRMTYNLIQKVDPEGKPRW
jgi:hypothetical protein